MLASGVSGWVFVAVADGEFVAATCGGDCAVAQLPLNKRIPTRSKTSMGFAQLSTRTVPFRSRAELPLFTQIPFFAPAVLPGAARFRRRLYESPRDFKPT